jgi:hypothetical protein
MSIQKEMEAGLRSPEELACSFRAEVVDDSEVAEEWPSDPQEASSV